MSYQVNGRVRGGEVGLVVGLFGNRRAGLRSGEHCGQIGGEPGAQTVSDAAAVAMTEDVSEQFQKWRRRRY